MTEYDNTNRGAIWPNKKRRPDKQDPQFTGSLNVEGKEYWVSAWKKKPDASDSAPSLSFAITAKDEQPADPVPSTIDFDDDIPF